MKPDFHASFTCPPAELQRMSEPNYLKCHCQSCGNSIEFPAAGVGQTISCPHCHQSTVLSANVSTHAMQPSTPRPPPRPMKPLPPIEDSTPAPSPIPRGKLVGVSVVVLILAAAAVGLLVLRNRANSNTAKQETKSRPSTNSPAPSAKPAAAESTPSPIPSAPKSISDLKSGPITLEKAKGSSLVYAVGILRNDSVHQRFGVNIELELTDARGNKAGTAKDYRAVLEPRQEWRFRALVLDSKAVAAKVTSIREE